MNLYYNGFCNSVLWTLFHYVPLAMESNLQETRHLQAQWLAYKKANEQFSKAVLQVAHPGDIVWVQDYHLMLLPHLLRRSMPEMKIGWFLHTPFPSSGACEGGAASWLTASLFIPTHW